MRISKRALIIALSALLAVSLISNVVIYRHFESKYKPKFQLISSDIAWMDLGDFLAIQNQYSVEYQKLKKELLEVVNGPNINGTYGVYFEDLNTGAWIGINERDEFIPSSLLKVPVIVAVLKKIEKGELSLDQKVSLKAEDLDLKSGTLGLKGEGYELTVRELLVYLIKESDNTALFTIYSQLLDETDVAEAKLAMGLPVGDNDNFYAIGPKHYSNILRSLYYSAYLRRTFSELALSLMSETEYNTQLPAGLPKNIPISHKIGFFYSEDGKAGYHDCGIIYYPNKPYILCVMSTNTSKAEADITIARISKTTYAYTDKKFKG